MCQIGTLIQTLAKGGPVMIPLLGCSIVALAVVIERLGFWWRQGDPRVVERALELAERGKLDEVLEVARHARGAPARATAAGLAIAIATLVPYNYFQARAERAMDVMERLASRLDLALREQQVP